MTAAEEALRALHSSGEIAREDVRRWMNADIEAQAITYVLTDKAWSRIRPELSMNEQCAFMRDYLCTCLVQGPKTGDTGDYLHSGFEAAWEIAGWLKNLAAIENTAAVIQSVAAKLRDIYIGGNDELRNRIETGALEHMLEEPLLVPFFESWRSDPQLREAFERALEWGLAHPPHRK